MKIIMAEMVVDDDRYQMVFNSSPSKK